MRKLKIKRLKYYNKVIAILLTFLGFSACSEDVITSRAEYGVPSADFKVNGAVQSMLNNQKIPNIRVIVSDTSLYPIFQDDTTYSNSEGKFAATVNAFPDSRTLKISFSDVDGAQNGEFSSKDTLVEFIDPQFIGGNNHWYSGYVSKVVNMKLLPKNE